MQATKVSRRDALKYVAASVCAGGVMSVAAREARRIKPKLVAAVMTVYRPGSHADVLIGKVLEGWKQDGGAGPALKLASMYVDQFPRQDLARKLAKKYDVPLFDTI